MGRGANQETASASLRSNSFSELRQRQQQALAEATSAASEAIGIQPTSANNGYIYWHPDEDSEISLCLRHQDNGIHVTRISCEPQGKGYGHKIVQSLRDYCQQEKLDLVIPDPYDTALSFWRRWDWDEAEDPYRTVLTYRPTQ